MDKSPKYQPSDRSDINQDYFYDEIRPDLYNDDIQLDYSYDDFKPEQNHYEPENYYNDPQRDYYEPEKQYYEPEEPEKQYYEPRNQYQYQINGPAEPDYYQTNFVSTPIGSKAPYYQYPESKIPVQKVQYGLVKSDNHYRFSTGKLLNYHLQPALSFYNNIAGTGRVKTKLYCRHYYGYILPC